MRLYQYKAAGSNWYVIATFNVIKHGDYSVQDMIEAWCTDTYDATTKTKCYVGMDAPVESTWGFGSGDYYFKNESDAFMFVLRWSGEK